MFVGMKVNIDGQPHVVKAVRVKSIKEVPFERLPIRRKYGK